MQRTGEYLRNVQSNARICAAVISNDPQPSIDMLRDRERSFELPITGKQEPLFTGLDQKIVAMYARGMTERAIQGYLSAMHGTEVSPEYIGKVTDEVTGAIMAWQERPLEQMYPVMFFDLLRVTVRDDAMVRHKAVCLALGILPDGTRDVLGIWIAQTEGTEFWLKVLCELRNRGVGDILIAVVDGSREVSEAIEATFPGTAVQADIMHLIRTSLDYASCKDRKTVAEALRSIYAATSGTAACEALEKFASGPWGTKYPIIMHAWRQIWGEIISFVTLPLEVRRVIYGTTMVESLHVQLRRSIKTRGHFPSDNAASKLLWLALRNSRTHKVRSTREWKMAMNQFATLYGDRFINPS